MKFTDFLNEELEVTGLDLDPVVHDVWDKFFKNTYRSSGKTAMYEGKYNIYKFYLGKDKSEYTNGISQNDPLSLMVTIDTSKGSYEVKFESKSISITPDNKYLAYGRHVFSLRKFTAKNVKDLENKLQKSFKKVHDDIEELINDGKMDVYKDSVKLFKSKLK